MFFLFHGAAKQLPENQPMVRTLTPYYFTIPHSTNSLFTILYFTILYSPLTTLFYNRLYLTFGHVLMTSKYIQKRSICFYRFMHIS